MSPGADTPSQSLFGNLRSMLDSSPSDAPAAETQEDQAAVTEAQPLSEAPDTFGFDDSDDDILAEKPSTGLTLLATADDSDYDDSDVEGFGGDSIFPPLGKPRTGEKPSWPDSSESAQPMDRGVGGMVEHQLGPLDELESRTRGAGAMGSFGQIAKGHARSRDNTLHTGMDEDTLGIDDLDSADGRERQLSMADARDAEEQGRMIANLHKADTLRQRAQDNEEMRKQAIGVFRTEDLYEGYQIALKRQAQFNRDVAAGKRQKADLHSASKPAKVPSLPETTLPVASTSKGSEGPKLARYALPPEAGEFISTRTCSGKALYFGIRSEIDLAKRMDRMALADEDAGQRGSTWANHIVGDIENTLDMEAAVQASEMDMCHDSSDGDPGPISTSSRKSGAEKADANRLWVDKYRARSFLDLISDERTNRVVMEWVKEWDYCVFGRESRASKRGSLLAKQAAVRQKGDKVQMAAVNDKWKRPQRRILLLSGPPGLGKTTLAHIVARQAGYNPVEINASDDRTASKVRDRILGVTQTHSMGMAGTSGSRPQLLLIDEIDGASGAQSSQGDFISMLVKLATTDAEPAERKTTKKGTQKRRRGDHGPLLRPIICICNNVYAPVLRPLRQVAQCYQVNAPTSARLAQRLEDVCAQEGVAADMWGLLELAKQNEGDIRSCLNALQMASQQQKLRKIDSEMVKSNGHVGMKDIQRSLFTIWGMIFTQPNQSTSSASWQSKGKLKGASIEQSHASLILTSVRSAGEHERLMQGCFENYLRMDFRDLTHTKVSDLCSDWFEFYDHVDIACRKNPSGTDGILPYLDYPLLAVHRTCSTVLGMSRDNFEYPHSDYEMFQGRQMAMGILQSLAAGSISARMRAAQTPAVVATCLLDYLLHIMSPQQLVTSNCQLLKGTELDRMRRLVEVMDSWQLSLVQSKDANGQFAYNLEPPIHRLFGFSERRPAMPVMPMRYAVRQLISQELERARTARLAASTASVIDDNSSQDAKDAAKREYLSKLFSDPVAEKAAAAPAMKGAGSLGAGDTSGGLPVTKDFFGRTVPTKKPSRGPSTEQAEAMDIVQEEVPSKAWFHFFEGFSNAVRKPTQMKELFHT